jgi:hypothetical protein
MRIQETRSVNCLIGVLNCYLSWHKNLQKVLENQVPATLDLDEGLRLRSLQRGYGCPINRSTLASRIQGSRGVGRSRVRNPGQIDDR